MDSEVVKPAVVLIVTALRQARHRPFWSSYQGIGKGLLCVLTVVPQTSEGAVS